MKLVERDYLRTKVRELPHMTKVHCFMNNIEKLVSIFSYIDKTFFERRYEIITHLDLVYKCFTFRDIDLTLTIEEYAQILNFPNVYYKVYFIQRIGGMTIEIAKLLHLDQVDQYRTTNEKFKWKFIETKLKTYKDEWNLGEERYQTDVLVIFEFVLFPLEAPGIISVEFANAFVQYE
ncbi:hypothetical protein Peur_060939 [Populus x canadensis]